MITKKVAGASLAIAAAGLLLSGCASQGMATETQTAQVKCAGINSCKGQTACKSASNECKGQNSCKGHGWMSTSAMECKDKGGTVL